MSADQQSTFTQRVSGKWQVPLLLVAALLFSATLIWGRPTPVPPPVEAHLEQIRVMAGSLMLPEAAGLARTVLADERYTPEALAPVHAALGEVLYLQESRHSSHEDHALVRILAIYAQAEVLGYAFSGDDLAHQGHIMEWLNRPASAAEHYALALRRSPGDPLDTRKRLVSLHLGPVPADHDRVQGELTDLIRDAAGRPEILTWAIEQRIESLLDEGRVAEADALVTENRAGLIGSSHELFMEYLSALVAYRTGRYDDAELTLRNLRGRLPGRDEMDARSAWLLGRVVMRDDGPQRPLQAIDLFEQVLVSHPTSLYATAARLGTAEALTQLQRYEEALDFYGELLQDLRTVQTGRLINRAAVQSSLTVLSQQLAEQEHLDHALAYFQIASDMVDPSDLDRRAMYLGDLAALKERVATSKRRKALDAAALRAAREFEQRGRDLLLSAADDYLTLSEIRPEDEDFTADALWQAAILSDAGGARGRTVALMEDFLKSRPNGAYLPRVLHRLGQAYQAEGELERAVARYQRCLREFPRTGPAQDSIIPLADCFIMMGPDRAAQAEQTLLHIVEEPPDQPAMFTPQSALYRDALFRLGELYARDARYDEAIIRLDEALQRYSNDARLPRGTFLIADAYRKSALAIDEVSQHIGNTVRRQNLQRRKRERLLEAEARFGQVIGLLGDLPDARRTQAERMQLMLSYMYRADCAFDARDFEAALERYQEVLRVYSDHPLALAAYVQVVSCLETVGRREDVQPALRRAQYLAGRIDPARFEDGLTGRDAAGWKRLFTWLQDTVQYN